MIYRKRKVKSAYALKLTDNFLRIELGKHVWYTPFVPMGKPWSPTIRKIRDVQGVETVTHIRRRDRVTIGTETNEVLREIAQAFIEDIKGHH